MSTKFCKVNIELSNAAFDSPDELPRLLRAAAKKVEAFGTGYRWTDGLYDANGNVVGNIRIVEEK